MNAASTVNGSVLDGIVSAAKPWPFAPELGTDRRLGQSLHIGDQAIGSLDGHSGHLGEVPCMHQKLEAQDACHHGGRCFAFAEWHHTFGATLTPGCERRLHASSDVVLGALRLDVIRNIGSSTGTEPLHASHEVLDEVMGGVALTWCCLLAVVRTEVAHTFRDR